MPQIISLAIACFVLYVLWTACQPRWKVKIVVRPGAQPDINGLPRAKFGEAEDFLRNNLPLPTRITIYALKDESGRVRTKIDGKLDVGLQQRVRNFMHALM